MGCASSTAAAVLQQQHRDKNGLESNSPGAARPRGRMRLSSTSGSNGTIASQVIYHDARVTVITKDNFAAISPGAPRRKTSRAASARESGGNGAAADGVDRFAALYDAGFPSGGDGGDSGIPDDRSDCGEDSPSEEEEEMVMMVMLKEETLATVDATSSLVASRLFDIASHFYTRLFEQHPDVKTMFNERNQRNETQPRALTDSIFNCVQNIADLGRIRADLVTIAHKHVALGVQPPGYKIVHDVFLSATAEVLGEAVTPPVAAAWSDVVSHVANHLISLEREVYAACTARRGGWDPMMPKAFKVVKISGRKQPITTLYLAPEDPDSPPPAFTPGQYVTVVSAPNIAPRHFSISHNKDLRISVQAIPGTRSTPPGLMSSYLRNLAIGQVIHLRPPLGTFQLFPLCGDASHVTDVFISEGLGITPTLGMGLEALEAGRRVISIHAGEGVELHEELSKAIDRANRTTERQQSTSRSKGARGRSSSASNVRSFGVHGPRSLLYDTHSVLRMAMSATQLHTDDATGIRPLLAANYYISAGARMLERVARQLHELGISLERQVKVEGFGPKSRFAFQDVPACPLHHVGIAGSDTPVSSDVPEDKTADESSGEDEVTRTSACPFAPAAGTG